MINMLFAPIALAFLSSLAFVDAILPPTDIPFRHVVPPPPPNQQFTYQQNPPTPENQHPFTHYRIFSRPRLTQDPPRPNPPTRSNSYPANQHRTHYRTSPPPRRTRNPPRPNPQTSPTPPTRSNSYPANQHRTHHRTSPLPRLTEDPPISTRPNSPPNQLPNTRRRPNNPMPSRMPPDPPDLPLNDPRAPDHHTTLSGDFYDAAREHMENSRFTITTRTRQRETNAAMKMSQRGDYHLQRAETAEVLQRHQEAADEDPFDVKSPPDPDISDPIAKEHHLAYAGLHRGAARQLFMGTRHWNDRIDQATYHEEQAEIAAAYQSGASRT